MPYVYSSQYDLNAHTSQQNALGKEIDDIRYMYKSMLFPSLRRSKLFVSFKSDSMLFKIIFVVAISQLFTLIHIHK